MTPFDPESEDAKRILGMIREELEANLWSFDQYDASCRDYMDEIDAIEMLRLYNFCVDVLESEDDEDPEESVEESDIGFVMSLGARALLGMMRSRVC